MSTLPMTTGDIRKKFKEGVDISVLAQLNATNTSIIRAIVQDLIPETQPKLGPLPVPVPEDWKDQAREMFGKLSDCEIARRIGKHQTAISKYRREIGVASCWVSGKPDPAKNPPLSRSTTVDKTLIDLEPVKEVALPVVDEEAIVEAVLKDMQSQQAKHDVGKPRLSLVPPSLIEAVGRVRTYGTMKYGSPDNWKTVEPWRYKDAMMRHICEYLRDPDSVDAESGLPHIEHIACNVAFLLEVRG